MQKDVNSKNLDEDEVVLSPELLGVLSKSLVNSLANEFLMLKRFDSFEKLLKYLDLSWGSPYAYSFTRSENAFCSAISYAPFELIEKMMPSFLVANQIAIAFEGFRGFEVEKPLSVAFCNAMDLKEQNDLSNFEKVKHKILKIIEIDNKEGLFSFEKKLSFNENKYFPIPYKTSYYSELTLMALVFALNDDDISKSFFTSNRMKGTLSGILKESSKAAILTNISFWQNYPVASKILFEEVFKNIKKPSEIKNIYEVPISSKVLQSFIFNNQDSIREVCIPKLLPYISSSLELLNFSERLDVFGKGLALFLSDSIYGKEVFVEVLRKILSKEFVPENSNKFFLQQLLLKGERKFVEIAEGLYKDFLSNQHSQRACAEASKSVSSDEKATGHLEEKQKEVDIGKEVDIYEMIFKEISEDKKKDLIKNFFYFPKEDWARAVKAAGGAKVLIGFNKERSGLDESFLMLALGKKGIDGFRFAVDVFNSEGLLKEALDEKAWVLSGSTRKKGDVLAYCVANGAQEAVEYIYELCPEIQSKSAKATVKKMVDSNISTSDTQRAQSAFDLLTLKQNLLNSEEVSKGSQDNKENDESLKKSNVFKRML